MNFKQFRGSLLLLLTALIWGSAFVAQSVGMDHVGPWTFQSIRTLIGGLALLPVILITDAVKKKKGTYRAPTPEERRTLLMGGAACGAVLCTAASLQQIGIGYTTVGKAGFITALYILIVPLLGLLWRKPVSLRMWCCIGVSVVGLYLLCMGEEGFALGYGDGLILLCAMVFAVHILVVDHFAPRTDPVKLSCLQFFVAGLVAAVPMLLFEHPQIADLIHAAFPLFWAGAMSCGVAYTLQIVGQRDTKPTVASLIMSLESVFAVFTAAVILREYPTWGEAVGCVLMLSAILVAQLPKKGETL